nr:hypothetical protein CFP56_11024 [Quercus suber]
MRREQSRRGVGRCKPSTGDQSVSRRNTRFSAGRDVTTPSELTLPCAANSHVADQSHPPATESFYHCILYMYLCAKISRYLVATQTKSTEDEVHLPFIAHGYETRGELFWCTPWMTMSFFMTT